MFKLEEDDEVPHMITVLFLIPTLDPGGAENVLVNLVNEMDQSKFKITVQTLFDQNSQKNQLRRGIEYKTFLYHQVHGNSRILARIPAELLYRVIIRKRYDIVVSYLEGPTTHILTGCLYPDSRKVAWVHIEMNSERQMSAGFRSPQAARKGYQKFDRLIFVANTVRDSFRKVTGVNFRNELVLYNTINSKMILDKAQDKFLSNHFSNDEFKIVSVGRIIYAKGFDRLAHIQKRLRDTGYRTHVFIVGTGKDQKQLETYVAKNDLTDTFTFWGFRENPYPIVASADLYVCSSRREGFSTAVTEALILGVPIVSTNCSGAVELLGEDNEYGIVTENDEISLLTGIKRLLDAPDLLAHYRRQAQKRGMAFNAESTVRAVEDMLTELAEKK